MFSSSDVDDSPLPIFKLFILDDEESGETIELGNGDGNDCPGMIGSTIRLLTYQRPLAGTISRTGKTHG
jgi:hypothetical protein